MFSLPTTVTIAGREVPVRTDFRVILEIFVMLHDPELSDNDKAEALLRMFYEDHPADAGAAIKAFIDFVDPNCLHGYCEPVRTLAWHVRTLAWHVRSHTE